MENTFNKGRILVVSVIWLSILGMCSLVYHYWYAPKKHAEAVQQAIAEKKVTIEKTSASSRYQHAISFAADSFSGYAPIRSAAFKEECAKYAIRIDLSDDGANYRDRLKGLADGRIDMAVFTIDALVKCCAEIGEFPSTIVALIDESKGADALVAAGGTFPNIDSMNDPSVKIVCVPDSPSETMARVIMAHFNLDKLGDNPFEFKNTVEEVYKSYKESKPTDKKVFAVWEPYVTRMIDNPDYHVLMDSSKFRGYVVDVIVVNRGYLLKNELLVEQVVKSYLTTMFNSRNNMVQLVIDDAKAIGDPLKKEQAERLVNSIWWKNTQEAFGHYGLTSGSGLQHMEEMCRNIINVLIKTKAISGDPTHGQPTVMYYDGIMRKLFDTSWHPGFGPETVRQEKSLVALSDDEWGRLRPVGTLFVPRLVFARGTDNLSSGSETILQDLSEQLKAFPQYYLTVKGNAASDGDLQANLKLASSRANAAAQWLIEHGVEKSRIRAESAKPNGSSTVLFILGEQPY